MKTILAAVAMLGLSTAASHATPAVEAAPEPAVVACPVTSNDARNDTMYRIVGSGEPAAVQPPCRLVSMQELADQGVIVKPGVDGHPARFDVKR